MIYDAKKLDPNVVTTVSIGETGLHLAARAGYLEFVKFLLEAGANVNQKGTSNPNVPLHSSLTFVPTKQFSDMHFLKQGLRIVYCEKYTKVFIVTQLVYTQMIRKK